MYKKIWVTGGTGLLGTAFQSIKDEYQNIDFRFTSSKDCNLMNSSQVDWFMKANHFDAVIHLATMSGGIGQSMNHPATVLRSNTLMNMNVIESSKKYQIKKLVMTLSTGMYGNNLPQPMKEESIHDSKPDKSNYCQAFANRLVEPLIKGYREEFGLNVIGLIPNGILGENGNYREGESTMVFALIRRFYENRNNNKPIVVWGDGSPLREYTYAKDLAHAYMWALDNYNDAQVIHVGSTEEHSIKDVSYMIADIMDINKERIEFDVSKPNGQFKKSTDNSKFIKLSGFKYTLFGVALNNTIKDFVENYDNGKLRL